MPVFFIPSSHIRGDMLSVTGPLLDHLRKSLRVKVGEELTIGDERRTRYRIRIASFTSRELRGRILDRHTGPPQDHPAVILAQALIKGERMDWVVQKATELGVAAIVPLVTDRVIVRPRPERIESQQERWRRIALEAAQQSERWDVPMIERPTALALWVREIHAASKLFLAERSQGNSLTRVELPKGRETQIVCCIGPEGGWTEQEQAVLSAAEFTAVGLGPGILRAETAAIAALAILWGRLGALE